MSKAKLRADAINRFIVDAKAQGVYDALKASCVTAGWDSLAGALTPLAGTAPSNNGFLAADYDRGTGLKGDGSTKYLNSNRAQDDDPQNDGHVSVYVQSATGSDEAWIGNINRTGTITAKGIFWRLSPAHIFGNINFAGLLNSDVYSGDATFAGVARSDASNQTLRAMGSDYTAEQTSVSPSADNIFVFARNDTDGSLDHSDARLAFYSIGSSPGPDPATGLAVLDTLVSRLLSDFRSIDEDGMDRDALAYIRNVEAADGGYLELGVKQAIDQFVRGCKYDGIWDAIKASCILCGARTLAGALVPLAGTAPTNLHFLPEDYNRETGLKGDGSMKYLNSNRANDADLKDDKHISAYATNLGNDSGVVRGLLFAGTGGTSGSAGIGYRNSDELSTFQVNNATSTFASGLSAGFVGASRSTGTEFLYRQNNSNSTALQASESPIASDILVYSRIGNLTSARLAFYSIGTAISDLALLDARVTALVTSIGAAL